MLVGRFNCRESAFLAARRSEEPKPRAGPRRAAAQESFFGIEGTQKTPEDVWSQWDASLPDAETLETLDDLQLSEAWRGALLMEAVRWAARGDAEWLQRWARGALRQPTVLEGEEPPVTRPSDIVRLALQCLAELLARSREGLRRNELRALVWFFEFMPQRPMRPMPGAGKAPAPDRQLQALRSSVDDELRAMDRHPFKTVKEGVPGGDLPICVGDVLTRVHDFCDALELECPWPRDLDNHLDVLLFVNLLQAFDCTRKWKPSVRSLRATRAHQSARQLILRLPLDQDTVTQQLRKMDRSAREDRERAVGTALELAWASEDPEVEEPSSFLEPQEAEPQLSGNVPVEDNEDKVDEGSKLSDVRQRRDARVKWDVEEEEEEEAPARNTGQTNRGWRQLRTIASDGGQLGRASMYMHHIAAPWKQKFILQVAKTAGLSGRCLFGKPGRILVEGPFEIVAKYTSQIQSWPWKTCNLQGPWQVEGRAFDDFDQLASSSEFKKAAHYASPFATTCGTVVQIAQAPAFQIQDALGRQPVKQVPPKQGGSPPLSSAAVLVSEDMAIRVFSAKSRALLSTLPPPPNAKVQVLEVFLCPEWQLLILWLSSEEVAIFYVPSAPLEKSKAEEQPIPRTQAATPLLLRRFSIVEVRTQMMDKDLSKESFRCVSLYHGPLPKGDTLLHTVKVAQQVLEEDSSPASPRRQIPKQTPPTGFHPLRSIGSRWLCRARAFLCSILGRRRRQCFRHGDKDGKELTLIAGASPVLQRPSVAVQRRASLHGAAAGLRATARRAARRRRTNHWVRGSSAGGKRSLAGGSLVNAKMDSKSLRKMGLMCLLSYGFVSNVNALLLILLATYRSIVATGASPLASPVALKQFGITWAGLYVISNIVRPVRISIALAISKPFDNMEKLSCKRWMAVGLVVLLLNVVLTIAFLWGGMLFVSSITGVKVDPSQFGTLVKAGKAAHAKH
eukprot:s3476_g8.t7